MVNVGMNVRHPTSNVQRPREEKAGSALIVALWIVVLLSMLVGAFAFDAHVEARLTSYYKKRTRAEYLARSGIEMAEMLMQKSGEVGRGPGENPDPDDRWFDAAKRLARGLGMRGVTETLGSGTIMIDVVPEPALRNVNKLSEEDWERVLEVSNIPEELWAELIDAANDWIDKDDDRRDDGAETLDYYATLDEPYTARNGPLDAVGDLSYVRGFTRAILYGGVVETGFEEEEPIVTPGIARLLTTYGDGKVNVNAASKDVLMTLPAVDDLVAEEIIDQREGWDKETAKTEDTSFDGVDGFMSRVWGIDASVREHVSTDSKIFRVKSTGESGGVKRDVWAIVEYGGKEKRGKILQWREQD